MHDHIFLGGNIKHIYTTIQHFIIMEIPVFVFFIRKCRNF